MQAGASQSAAFLLCSKTGGAGVLWERLVHDGRYNGKLQGQWIGKEKERFHAPGAHHRRGDCGDFVGGGYAGYPWHDKCCVGGSYSGGSVGDRNGVRDVLREEWRVPDGAFAAGGYDRGEWVSEENAGAAG